MDDVLLELVDIGKIYPVTPTWLRLVARGASSTPTRALEDVSLVVGRGEVVGLIGPNGAGKTSLIKIVAGLVQPDAGTVRVCGYDPVDDRDLALRRLGLVLTDERGLYWRLTGRQNLEFFARLAGLGRKDALERADELLSRTGLAHRDKMVFGYSSGMRARLSISRALVTTPDLLVLDEPTRSLDPIASAETGALVRGLADAGHGVLFSSHRLDEVVQYCDRVAVLVGGRITTTLSRDELTTGGAASTQLAAILTRDVVQK